MLFSITRIRYLSLLVLLVLTLEPINADETKKYEQSIGEIGEKIKAVTKNLNANKELRASEQEKLLALEQKMAVLDKSLLDLEYELAKTSHEAEGLSLQIATLEKKAGK